MHAVRCGLNYELSIFLEVFHDSESCFTLASGMAKNRAATTGAWTLSLLRHKTVTDAHYIMRSVHPVATSRHIMTTKRLVLSDQRFPTQQFTGRVEIRAIPLL